MSRPSPSLAAALPPSPVARVSGNQGTKLDACSDCTAAATAGTAGTAATAAAADDDSDDNDDCDDNDDNDDSCTTPGAGKHDVYRLCALLVLAVAELWAKPLHNYTAAVVLFVRRRASKQHIL